MKGLSNGENYNNVKNSMKHVNVHYVYRNNVFYLFQYIHIYVYIYISGGHRLIFLI